MLPDIKIAPSVLSADFTRLGEHIAQADAGGADMIHIDVMDGQFVPPISFGDVVVKAARRITTLPIDVHFMVLNPERQIDAFVKAGANKLTVHTETCPHLNMTLQQIRQAGASPAVTLNPATPISMLEEVYPYVDMILVMTVNPGWGGQKLIPETLDKVRRLREIIDRNGYNIDIQVDGGISTVTAAAAVDAGANILVAGNAVFGSGDVAANISAIRTAAKGN